MNRLKTSVITCVIPYILLFVLLLLRLLILLLKFLLSLKKVVLPASMEDIWLYGSLYALFSVIWSGMTGSGLHEVAVDRLQRLPCFWPKQCSSQPEI